MSADAVGWVYRYSPFRGGTFQIHLAAADSVNDQNQNELWMAVPTLAIKARLDNRTVQRALRELTSFGYLVLLAQSSGKPGDPNRYRFLFPETPVVYQTRWTGDTVSPLRVTLTTETGDTVPPKPKEATQRSKPQGLGLELVGASFEDFWAVYPLHVKKADARRAWDRAVSRHTSPVAILEGARRYAIQQADPDAPHTAYPSTWLNGARWEDEPLPARRRSGPRSVADQNMETAARMLGRGPR